MKSNLKNKFTQIYRKTYKIKQNPALVFLIFFLWLGILFTQLTSEPVRFPDTPSYLGDPKKLDGFFSLTGDAIRGWPTVLAYWLVNSDYQRTILQTILFGTSWTLLLLAWIRDKGYVYTLLIGVTIVSLALTPRVIQWNSYLLSESISISLLISGIAAFRFSLNKQSYKTKYLNLIPPPTLVLGIILFSLAVVNRASLLIVSIAPFFLILSLFLKKQINVQALLIGIVLAIFATIYHLNYNAKTDEFWGGNGDRLSRSSFYFLYNTIDDSLQPEWGDKLWRYVSDQAPQCLENFRASGTDPNRNAYYFADVMPKYCPEGIKWLNENYKKTFITFAFNNPIMVISYASDMINFVQDSAPYPVTTLLPKSIAQLFESRYDGSYTYRPHLGWIAFAVSGLVGMIFYRVKPNFKTALALVLFVSGLFSITVTQFVIVSEPVRITTPATVMTLTSCILFIGESISQISTKVKNEFTFNKKSKFES